MIPVLLSYCPAHLNGKAASKMMGHLNSSSAANGADRKLCAQIVANGRRNVRHRDGRPLAIAVTEGLRESGVPLVRTYQYATHCACTRSSLLSKPDQVSRCS